MFSYEFEIFLRTPFTIKHIRWLLLDFRTAVPWNPSKKAASVYFYQHLEEKVVKVNNTDRAKQSSADVVEKRRSEIFAEYTRKHVGVSFK